MPSFSCKNAMSSTLTYFYVFDILIKKYRAELRDKIGGYFHGRK